MADNDPTPRIPEDLQDILTALHGLAGENGMVAEVDWTKQILSVTGLIGENPETLDQEEKEAIIELSDEQINSKLLNQFDITLDSRRVADNGLKYNFDISFCVTEQPYILRVRLHPDHSSRPPSQNSENIEWIRK